MYAFNHLQRNVIILEPRPFPEVEIVVLYYYIHNSVDVDILFLPKRG